MAAPRDAFYSHKFCRLLMKTCAAQAIGRDACLLLCFVAHTEDSARYRGPVSFWNSQLMLLLGMNTQKSLIQAREKAITAGWLEYTRQGTRSVGLYRTLIPAEFSGLNDHFAGESDNGLLSDYCHTGSNQEVIGNSWGSNQELLGNSCDTPSTLALPLSLSLEEAASKKAAPKRKRFVPPTVEQVSEYVQSKSMNVDPQRFVDHYEANGWVQAGGQKIRDWKAACRTWNGRQQPRTSSRNGNKPSLDDLVFDK